MKKRLFALLVVAMMMATMIPTVVFAADETILPDEMHGEWQGGSHTVYYDGSYYNTLADAIAGVYESSPTDVAVVYCKPGADLGSMTHGHVADDLTIYGNGAYLSGGEQDLEIDYYKFVRTNGKASNDAGQYLEKDITVKAKNLGGIAVWGNRNTEYEINVIFEDCKNIGKVFISGTKGINNITVTNCTFDAAQGSNRNTGIFSNTGGEIIVENTKFSGIAVPVNLNNKAAGATMTVSVENCTFDDCATPDLAAAESAGTYAAPIRVVNSAGEGLDLTVDTCEFTYTGEPSANGDILLGNGAEELGIVAEVTNTDAEVKRHESGKSAAESTAYSVTQEETLFTDENEEIKIEENVPPTVPGDDDDNDEQDKPEDGNGNIDDEQNKPEGDNGNTDDEQGKPETDNGNGDQEQSKPEAGNDKGDVEQKKPEKSDAQEKEKAPSTGDQGGAALLLLAVASLTSMAGTTVLRKKRA